MKRILQLLFILIGLNSFAQNTYVPDDAFESFLETYYNASNGVSNDNYVSTSIIQSITGLSINSSLIPSGTINDFTGISAFNSLNTVGIQYMNMTNIDLSDLLIVSSGGIFDFQLTIQYCNMVENLILPHGGGIKLNVTQCLSLKNITYHSDNIIEMLNIISSCPSLTSFDISMVSFVELQSQIWLANNSSLQCVNLKNGYCSNWASVGVTGNPLVSCVEVDNPNYCNTASGNTWNWDNHTINPNNVYSTNCNCLLDIGEIPEISKDVVKIIDFLGRETVLIPNTPLIIIYSDGSTERLFKTVE
jgi:trimeric autotransporter adhesin